MSFVYVFANFLGLTNPYTNATRSTLKPHYLISLEIEHIPNDFIQARFNIVNYSFKVLCIINMVHILGEEPPANF